MAAYDTLTDLELTELLRQGNERAFTSIYRRHWNEVYLSAYNRLRDRTQCQDLVQNVFTTLWDRRDDADIHNLAAYLHTAARFQAIKFAGRQRGSSILLDTFEELMASPEQTDDLLIEKELLHLLHLFVDALPAKRRAIFIMRYTDNRTTAEIAEEMGIAQKTVQNQLNNAEIALRTRLAHILSLSVLISFWHSR